MAVSAVWTLIYLLAHIGTKEQHCRTQEGRLCSSPRIQKQVAFDISLNKKEALLAESLLGF
jgi:hypothetical protein